MNKKTIDQKIDELARITTKGFRSLQKEAAELRGDVNELRGDVNELRSNVNELQQGFSWMRHQIEVMAIDIKDIKRSLNNIEMRLQVVEELYEEGGKERVILKKELEKIKERVAFLEAKLEGSI